jgi:peptide/nickel transport system substrate-binding protein
MSIGLFGGCSKTQQNKETQTVKPTVVESKKASEESFSQAPRLMELVKSAKLPAVENRLPVKEDIMIEDMESIGTYGEAFNFTYKGKSSQWWYGKATEEALFRFKQDGTVEPNVAKGYEVNADSTVYTIHLRQGMKWSDGVDFTADDVIFFYDEMCVKETFGKSLWDCFKVKDKEGKQTTADFKKIDNYTFTVTFKASKPTFLEDLAINGKWCFAPAHWYKQILPGFIGEEAAKAKAKEMGYADVASMGKETGYYYWNVAGRPTLRPWIITKDGKNNDCDGEYFVMERNPYYWKTDKKGQQLPYIDELRFTKISDDQQALLKVLDGSTDILEMAYTDYDVLTENQAKSGYELLEWSNTSWAANNSQLQLNQTAKNDNLRALFQNINFRQALSIAVDRKEFAEIISDGFAKGKQASPSEGALGYSKQWSDKWTEYDQVKARTLLESCGLVKGSDRYYDFSDGSDFVLNIQTFTESHADKSAELMMKYFGAVGIKTTYKPVDRTVLDNMTTSNDHEAILAPVALAESLSIILRPDTLVPVRNYSPWYGTVGNWYASKGKEGMAPTGDLLKLCNLYDNLRAATNHQQQEKIALDMLKLHQENTWIIGYMEDLPVLIAKNSKIKNFVNHSVYCDEFRGLGIAHLQNCYFQK